MTGGKMGAGCHPHPTYRRGGEGADRPSPPPWGIVLSVQANSGCAKVNKTSLEKFMYKYESAVG